MVLQLKVVLKHVGRYLTKKTKPSIYFLSHFYLLVCKWVGHCFAFWKFDETNRLGFYKRIHQNFHVDFCYSINLSVGLYLSSFFLLFLLSPCSETIFGYHNLEVQVGSCLQSCVPSYSLPFHPCADKLGLQFTGYIYWSQSCNKMLLIFF